MIQIMSQYPDTDKSSETVVLFVAYLGLSWGGENPPEIGKQ